MEGSADFRLPPPPYLERIRIRRHRQHYPDPTSVRGGPQPIWKHGSPSNKLARPIFQFRGQTPMQVLNIERVAGESRGRLYSKMESGLILIAERHLISQETPAPLAQDHQEVAVKRQRLMGSTASLEKDVVRHVESIAFERQSAFPFLSFSCQLLLFIRTSMLEPAYCPEEYTQYMPGFTGEYRAGGTSGIQLILICLSQSSV